MKKLKIREDHKSKNRRLLFFGILTLMLPHLALSDLRKCDRQPEGHVAQKSPSDGRFRLRIEGNPEEYTPGRDYTVVLQGTKSHRTAHAFIGFMIVAEKATTDLEDLLQPDMSSTGTFSLIGDNLSKFSDKCPNAVTQTSAIQKRDVRVIWRAPIVSTGCVVFRATVVEHRDVWYMDDDHLVLTLCKDEQDTIEKQALIQHPCCACKEAKYELKFERIWSRHTHPKDFPMDSLSTRFSDIVGASHAASYRFWDYGRLATPGLKQLAEHGSTRDLEAELKTQSEYIRTIIKARGVMQANVTSKSFAVFRVDSQNHLISLVSMIDPSPDWIVGVSGLELCTADCEWVENKTIKLFPWDAGTDSGPSYLSPDQPTDPPDVLRRITPTFPNDINSPFYDPSGIDMKPMALLHITRQRLYERNCENADDDIVSENPCETTPWSDWNECNVRCGHGKQRRFRQFLDPIRAIEFNCNSTTALVKHKKCFVNEPYCNDHNNEDQPTDSNGYMSESDHDCELTEWSQWTTCSVSCGRGLQTRYRQYKMHDARDRCQSSSNNPPLLYDSQECKGDSCAGDIGSTRNIDTRCPTTKWSRWSPCSVSCGVGEKTRTRRLTSTSRNRLNRRPTRDDSGYPNYRSRFYNNDNNEDDDDEDEEEEEEDDGTIEGEYSRRNDVRRTTVGGTGPCAHVVLIEVAVCVNEDPRCGESQPRRCHFRPDIGINCRNSSSRFFYDPNIDDCSLLFYRGCGGNDNNFVTFEECQKTCRLAV